MPYLMYSKKIGTGTGWDVLNATYSGRNALFSPTISTVGGIAIKDNGTRLFVAGSASTNNKSRFYQWTFNTPYLIDEGLTYGGVIDFTPQLGTNGGRNDLWMSDDGTFLFATNFSSEIVVKMTMSTPWDITSASIVSTHNTSSDYAPVAVEFSADGLTMLVASFHDSFLTTNMDILEFTLSTPYTPPTNLFSSGATKIDIAEIDRGNGSEGVHDMKFGPGGTKLYVYARTVSDRIFEYDLSTPYDINTKTYAGTTGGLTGGGQWPENKFDIVNGHFYYSDANTRIYQQSF